VLKFKETVTVIGAGSAGSAEYAGTVSSDGTRLRFTFTASSPTPAEQQVRVDWLGGNPDGLDRFSGKEWLKQ
jgi:hypothetical protein